MPEKTLADWNSLVENDSDISLIFDNLQIGMKTGYGNEIQIMAKADSVAKS